MRSQADLKFTIFGGVAAAVTIGIFIAKFNRDKMHRDLDDY